jgi:hypothetical protein
MEDAQTLQDHLLVLVMLDLIFRLMVLHVKVINEHQLFLKNMSITMLCIVNQRKGNG